MRTLVRGGAALLLAVELLGCNAGARESLFPGRPNVVLVLIDALRRDHLGLYGYRQPTSPFLDRLAVDSFVFDLAFSQASETSVSTSTLFTSRFFPYQAGAKGEGHRQYSIAQGNKTVAEALAAHGYETFGVFTNPHHFPGSGYWQGFTESAYIEPNETGSFIRHPYGRAPEVVASFLGWLDRRGGEPESRFFAYLHFMDVHNPYEPPEELERQFVPVKGRRGLYRNGKPQGQDIPTAADLEALKGRYDAEIRYTDGQLAHLVRGVKERGLWDETVFVVTSDHGDEFMEHGGLGHNQTLEKEMVWIPLLLHSGAKPGDVPGRRIQALVRNLDLAPTLTEIAGIETPDEFQGQSLLPLIAGLEGARGADHSFAWYGDWCAVTTVNWHFVWNVKSHEHRLYDNLADPRGLVDVAPDHSEVVGRFHRLIEDYLAERTRAREISLMLAELDGSSLEEMSPEILGQLRALGYLD